LDSNADVGIGFSMSSAAICRRRSCASNASDDIESSLKYVVVQQAPAIPFSLAVRGGMDWRTERDVVDRTSSSRRRSSRADWNPRGDFRDPDLRDERGARSQRNDFGRALQTRVQCAGRAALMVRPD